ncbi:MAG TPA: polymer-forming cytoskeletal protein [Chthoniobacterales bacterium]
MFGSTPKTAPTPTAPAPAPSPARTEVPARPSAPARAANVLSAGVSITGDVTFQSELVIDGEVEGSIKSSGVLIVGEHGRIRGEVRAGTVTIRGTVEGNVFASDRCALEAGATLHGDIEAPRFAVDENAEFFGSAKISTKRG